MCVPFGEVGTLEVLHLIHFIPFLKCQTANLEVRSREKKNDERPARTRIQQDPDANSLIPEANTPQTLFLELKKKTDSHSLSAPHVNVQNVCRLSLPRSCFGVPTGSPLNYTFPLNHRVQIHIGSQETPDVAPYL